MTMTEMRRLIDALEASGMTAQEIIDLIRFVGSGDKKYQSNKN